MTARTRGGHRWLKVSLGVLLSFSVAVACLFWWPLAKPTSKTRDLSVVDAQRAYDDLVQTDAKDATLLPECRSARFDPGTPSRGTVLIFHGYTSCPHQFVAVAEALQADGYTVLVPRLPGHGYADRIVEQGSVDAGEVAEFGDRMVDVAAASTGEVTVVGLSGGASLSLWLRENRTEIARTVALAPLLNPAVVPTPARRAAANLLSVLPTVPVWWDFDLRERAQVPRYSYAQWQTHSIATFMALSDSIGADSETRISPVTLVTNDADGSVDNTAIRDLVTSLTARSDPVTNVSIPSSYGLAHEYVDPGDPDQKLAVILPGLVRLIETGDVAVMPK